MSEAPAGEPLVSIVVCAFNSIDLTHRCLDRVGETAAGVPHEVVLVDDGSDDPRAAELAARPDVRYVRSERNQGFTLAANLGAREARGAYLVFLNNDTEPQPGWLEALLDAGRDGPDVGAVGAMLLDRDGRLEEAGGVIWNDGGGLNYGIGGDPSAPEYRFRREVDYCSGACLLVRRELFEELGGFDELFAPGYYEDTDLCFRLRASGRTVLYEPDARVVHARGATFGTDDAPGTSSVHTKSAQSLNRLRFQAKWADELLRHLPTWAAGGRRGGRLPDRPRVLVSDHTLVPPDEASGALRLAWLLLLLHGLGCEVTVFPFDREERQPYADWLRRAGIEVYCTGGDIFELAASRTGLYDLVVLCRPHQAAAQRDAVRFGFPAALLVYDTVDLEFVREERMLALDGGGDPAALHRHARSKRNELDQIRAADVVGVVTETELELVRSLVPEVDGVLLPNVHAVRSTPVPGPEGRDGLLFIGGYKHLPNVDAVLWFVEEVLPLVREHEPARFEAVGTFPPEELTALASDTVSVPGYVADVSPAFDRARVFVSPLRAGAGMKGKIGMAMAFGLPVVTTSVGAEGMGLVDGVHALVADDAAGFAEAVVRLCRDDQLWRRLSGEARGLAAREWSPEAMSDRLRALVERTGAARGLRPRTWGLRNPELPL